MKRVALLGLGRIARSFLSLRAEEDEAHWSVVGAMRRDAARSGALPFPVVDSPQALAGLAPDLLIDFSGANALQAHGPRLLAIADIWTVGGAALADPALEQALLPVARETGHRLRLLPGAIGGLDALAAMALDPGAQITLVAATREDPEPRGHAESVRAVLRDNRGINVIAAAALAAHGLDRTQVDHAPVPPGGQRRFRIEARGAYGAFSASIDPVLDPERGTLIVAASAMVALRNAFRPIWVG